MKKLGLSLILLTLLAGGLSACGKKGDPVYHKNSEQNKTVKTSG